MVSIITISNSRTKLLRTFQGVIRSIRYAGLKNAEYVIVELENSAIEKKIDDDLGEIKIKHIIVKKGGFSIQRNIGVKESSNNIIVFIDDGMDIPPQWIQKIISPILSGESDAVMGAVIPKIIKDRRDTLTDLKNILILSQAVLGFPAGGLKMLSKGKFYIDSFSTSNLAILKKFVVEAGMFDEKLVFGAEDSDLSIRIKKMFPMAKFLYSSEAYVFTEPRENLKDIKKWFIRRGKSLATLVKKYEKVKLKKFLRREILLSKIIPLSFAPPVMIVFLTAYINQAQKILEQSSSSEFFPCEYKKIMKIALPIMKIYMDIWYSVGYYSEIFKP